MEISEIIGKTLKKPPAKEYIDSFKMLIRGGFIKVLRDNSIVFTSTLNRSTENLSIAIRGVFRAFREVSIFPKFSNDLLIEFLDSEISSYKQLPQKILYQFSQNNPKYFMKQGLLYPQNSQVMGFSQIHINNEIEKLVNDLETDLVKLFASLNISIDKYHSETAKASYSDNTVSYDFSILSEHGKDKFVLCTKCSYKAKREVAIIHKKADLAEDEIVLSEVETPESSTIVHLAQFLGVDESKCAKAVFYTSNNQKKSKLVLVIIRGDMEVNESKINQLLGVDNLKVASDDEIRKAGCVPGFASAIGINRELCTVIVDELIPQSKNLVAGANKIDFHFLNTNYDRDYTADIISDIALATENSNCKNCQSQLKIELGISLCKLTIDKENKSISYLNEKGKPFNGVLINFEFDLTRILGVLSLNIDKFGVIYPIRISPFQIVIITIGSESEVKDLGNKLHELLDLNFEILYDNRDVKLGVKLNDADLRSIPFRLIISKNSIENDEIEFSKRGSKDKRYFKLEKVLVELEQIKEVSMYKGF